ncbi:phosphoribosyl-ATP diphosphatase [Ferroglobus placidus DSM 10642]|uniref:Phosphoribosyl-ATP pyrophosphatase n=1 Tax=Ferroglobus placidus (strain DSM 10642 / AEDII12DO) TaxID=589924 RepID=D3S2S9_FERPA|nr:phosphoribosyl-ATP diphosphatase [Ferroglobus placidus]ADC66641.1 phosphoribosyl-ATP diphosphatase [Ferroglobus placidus DSM 10642]
MLEELQEIVEERKRNPTPDSYTAKLLYHEKGEDKVLEKFGEEAVELILACKNKDKESIVYEAADLLYHFVVLLSKFDVKVEEVYDELRRRKK